MGKQIETFIGRLWTLFLNGLMDIVYGLILLAQAYFCFSWAYRNIFAPMAAAPGSRDSAGLLLVAPIVFGGALLVWAGLAAVTQRALQAIFPDWTPVLFKH